MLLLCGGHCCHLPFVTASYCGLSWAAAELLCVAPPCRCPCLYLSPWLQGVNGAGLPSDVSTEKPMLAVGQAEGELQSLHCLDGLPMLTPVHQVSCARGQACRGLTAAIAPADLRALLLRQRHNGPSEATAVLAPAVDEHLSVEPVDMEEDTATAFPADSPPSVLQHAAGTPPTLIQQTM